MSRAGRYRREAQVFNAHEDFVDLTPVSEAPAENTRNNWSALLPGQEIPLIWEDRRHATYEEVRGEHA